MKYSRRRTILSELFSLILGATAIAVFTGFAFLARDGIETHKPTLLEQLYPTSRMTENSPVGNLENQRSPHGGEKLQRIMQASEYNAVAGTHIYSFDTRIEWFWLLALSTLATVRTKRKNSDSMLRRELEEREALLRTLFENASYGIFISDEDGNYSDVNQACCDMLGFSRDELLRMNLRELLFKEDWRNEPLRIDELRAGKTVIFETNLRKKSGDFLPVEISARMLPDGTLQGFARDISARKRSEAALRAEVQRKQKILHSMLDGYILAETNGQIVDVNPAYSQISGYSRDELVTMNVMQLEAKLIPKQMEERKALFRKQGWVRFETQHRRKDGRVIDLAVSTVMMQLDRTLVAAFMRDLTEHKKARELAKAQAAQQEAVAGLGRTALASEKLEDLFDQAVRDLANTLRVEYSKVLKIVPGEGKLLLLAGVGWRKGLVGKATVGAEKNSQAGYTLLSSEPVVVKNLRSEKRFSGPALLTDHGVVSGMSVIIGPEENPYGVLGVHTIKQRAFTEDDIHFLQSVANVLAAAIDRAAAEDAVRESERRYHALFEESPIPLWEEDFSEVKAVLDGLKRRRVKDFRKYFDRRPEVVARCVRLVRVLEVNKAALRLHEAESREQLQQGLSTIFTDASLAAFKEELVAIVGNLPRSEFAATVRTLSGKEKHILLRWEVVPGYEETLEKVVLSTIDFTERKRAERALRESETKFRVLAESTAAAILIFQEEQMVYVNPSACRITGYSENELLRMKFWEMVHPDFQEMVKDRGLSRQKGEDPERRYEVLLTTRGGAERWVDFTASLISFQGKPAVLGTAVDITESKQARQALQESEEKYRSLFEHNLAGVAISDPSGKMYATNDAMCEMTGYTRDELRRVNVKSLYVDPAVREHFLESMARLGKVENIESEMINKQGEHFWTSFSSARIRLKGNDAFITTVVDITERKRAEAELATHREHLEELVEQRTAELKNAQEELLRNERLAAIGQLTATVSHELRNPLATIRTSMYSINRKLRGTALGAERALERVKRNVSRCDHIIDGLLDYTRVRKMNLQRVDITVWLKEMLSDYELPAGIRLRKKLTARTFADIDVDGFRRVMINLLDNACQAMQELPENQKKRLVTVENGAGESRIEIRVADTGIGIPADRKPHIFEPLVSNKAFGVGLGLTVVKQIIEEHGGGVAVTSDDGKGTEVMLWLPQAKKQGGGS